MRYVPRLVVAIPFAIAALLNVLMLAGRARHRNTQHIAGYGLLFAAPWSWFIDPVLLAVPHRWEPMLRLHRPFVDSSIALFGVSLGLTSRFAAPPSSHLWTQGPVEVTRLPAYAI